MPIVVQKVYGTATPTFPGPRDIIANSGGTIRDLAFPSSVGADPWGSADDASYLQVNPAAASSPDRYWATVPVVPSEPIDLTYATQFCVMARMATDDGGTNTVAWTAVLYDGSVSSPALDLEDGTLRAGGGVSGSFSSPEEKRVVPSLVEAATWVDLLNSGNAWLGVSLTHTTASVTSRVYEVCIEITYDMPLVTSVGQLYVNLSTDPASPDWVSVCPGEGGGTGAPLATNFVDTNFTGGEGMEDWWQPGGNTMLFHCYTEPAGWRGAPVGTTTATEVRLEATGTGTGTLRFTVSKDYDYEGNYWAVHKSFPVDGSFTISWVPALEDMYYGSGFSMADFITVLNDNQTNGVGDSYLKVYVENTLPDSEFTLSEFNLVSYGGSGGSELVPVQYHSYDAGHQAIMESGVLADDSDATVTLLSSADIVDVAIRYDTAGLDPAATDLSLTVRARYISTNNTPPEYPQLVIDLHAIDNYSFSWYLNQSAATVNDVIRGYYMNMTAGLNVWTDFTVTINDAWLAAHPFSSYTEDWQAYDIANQPLTMATLVGHMIEHNTLVRLRSDNPTYEIEVSKVTLSAFGTGALTGAAGHWNTSTTETPNWEPIHLSSCSVNLGTGGAQEWWSCCSHTP